MIVHMIGQAHIDPVWMWAWQAGADEALATFRSAADRCDEYPEFIFTRGEAWVYQVVERIDPELFGRVRGLIERGQWHVVGDQYLQPDCNLPTEEAWRQQFRHGRRYFHNRFGTRSTVAFNVDSFGHPATLPDILASEGYTGYVFHRPNEQQVALPSAAFRWRGSGGAEVIGFRLAPGYVTRTDDLWGQITVAIETADPAIGHTMCFYGVGNHGGGPTRGSIEYILANRHAFAGHELRFSTPQAFFDAIAANRERLPLVEEELQHVFPGCYSVMHDIKQSQRRGELLLERATSAAERFAAGVHQRDLLDRVDRAWEDLLFTEFHDILSGTSIPSAWEGVRAMQGRARIAGEEAVYEATRRWARSTLASAAFQQIAVVNPDPNEWDDLIEHEPWLEFDIWGDRWLSTPAGEPVDLQLIQPEAQQGVNRILFPANVPAGTAAQVQIRDDPPPDHTPDSDLSISEQHLGNSHVRIDLDESGVSDITFGGRALLGDRGIRLHLRHDHLDTWGFTNDRFEEPVDAVLTANWIVEESGPLRARVRTEGWLAHSWLRWTLSLQRNDPRLWMLLEVTFAERYKLLQLPIHLATVPRRWTDGLAGGHVERGPNPAEWPVLGWSRVEVDGSALAMVTHDAWSLSLVDDVWQWTLLRGPRMSWGGRAPEVYVGRDWHTDQGQHTFSFQLIPGAVLNPARLHAAARQLAMPPLTFDRYEGMQRPPWGAQAPRRLWTGAEQRAEAAGRLRLPIDERGSDPFST